MPTATATHFCALLDSFIKNVFLFTIGSVECVSALCSIFVQPTRVLVFCFQDGKNDRHARKYSIVLYYVISDDLCVYSFSTSFSFVKQLQRCAVPGVLKRPHKMRYEPRLQTERASLNYITSADHLLLLEYTRQHSHKRKQKIIFAIEYLSIVCATHNLCTHVCVYILLLLLFISIELKQWKRTKSMNGSEKAKAANK